jgi:hypothetical protein
VKSHFDKKDVGEIPMAVKYRPSKRYVWEVTVDRGKSVAEGKYLFLLQLDRTVTNCNKRQFIVPWHQFEEMNQ